MLAASPFRFPLTLSLRTFPSVSPTSRRITLYWLLLLLPTLLVGAAAIGLLRREEQRLARQGEQALGARRAAMEAQTRLMAENVELLIDDVQAGLLETLGAAQSGDVDAVLAQWREVNPLVRGVFRGTSDGEILWPQAAGANEETRGFVRRAMELIQQQRPWSQEVAAPALAQARASTANERKATANLEQVQSARRGVQQLLRDSDFAANRMANEETAAAEAARRSQVARAESFARSRQSAEAATTPRAKARRVPGDAADDAAESSLAPSAPPIVTASPQPAAAPVAAGRRGWTVLTNGPYRHVFGWVVLTRGGAAPDEVRGVELELQALLARVGGALPREVEAGEAYELRDSSGRTLHRVGQQPVATKGRAYAEPTVRTALSNPLFQGWDVVGFEPAGVPSGPAGAAFFWVGTLLVAIFLTAILAGGSLLLWQARRSEAEAVQKTSFVANVSHEFKTPLTTIRLFAELLEQGRIRDEAQRVEYLRTIERETQRLSRLVNNVLDFSRLEQGRKKFARERFDLVPELSRLLDTHAVRVGEAGLRLTRELPADALEITSDRDAIGQIVLNLLDNACKYAADGAELHVGLTSPAREEGGASARVPGHVRLTVADRGPGVSAEHRERIFDKFHRVDETLTAEKAGAGLGLSIARQLARGLGGDLRYEDRPGGGASFTLEIPLSPE